MATSKFPASVWDGVPANTNRDPSTNEAPDYQDWDQIVAEMIAVQTVIVNAGVNVVNPPAKATFPGTATGTDADVINAIVTILSDRGFCDPAPEE